MNKSNMGCFDYVIILIILALIIRYWYLVLILAAILLIVFFVYKHREKEKNKSTKLKNNIISENDSAETNNSVKEKKETVETSNVVKEEKETIETKEPQPVKVEPIKVENNPISTDKQQSKPKYKLLFQTNIVGSSFHKGDIKRAIKEAKDFLPLGLYQGVSNKEIREEYLYGEKVYEICDSDDIGIFHLVKEPDNQYDKNAIAVKIETYSNEDLTIGYIPRDKTSQCSQFMDNNDPNITYNFHFGGGKYKTLAEDEFGEDKVKIKNSSYWFELQILLKV